MSIYIYINKTLVKSAQKLKTETKVLKLYKKNKKKKKVNECEISSVIFQLVE